MAVTFQLLPILEMSYFRGFGKYPSKLLLPNEFLFSCVNAICKNNGTIEKRPPFQFGELLANKPLFVFLANPTSAIVPYLIVVTAANIYGKLITAGSFTTLASSRSMPTYCSATVLTNRIYIFDDANAPVYWDFIAGSVTAVATPPSEVCAEIIEHKGFLFACQSATNKDYVFFTQLTGGTWDTFKTLWALRIPDERSGYKALRLFSFDDVIVALTDKCPILISGIGPSSFNVEQKKRLQGMRMQTPRAACKGRMGIYFLGTDLEIYKFDGQDNYNITRPFFDEWLKNDISGLGTTAIESLINMWSENGYIYFSYKSTELNDGRILVFDELMQTWIGDYQGWNISHSAPIGSMGLKDTNVSRIVNSKTETDPDQNKSLIKFPGAAGSENFISKIETKSYDPAIGFIKHFQDLTVELKTESSGTLITYAFVDVSPYTSPTSTSSSISLTASGQRYGDEDNEIITRKYISHTWILPHNASNITSGRNIGYGLQHSGTGSFNLLKMYAKNYLANDIEEQKEQTKW